MENINKNDFIDVYVLKTLNEIKNSVSKNRIIFDKEKEIIADKKMSVILKDLINSNFKNLQLDLKGNIIYTFLPIIDEQENEKVRFSLMLYYTALYYENVDLLHDLLKENIKFEDRYSVKLQYLDKSISSRFDRETYIKYIKTCGEIFIKFAYSISGVCEEEREKYILRFVKLFNLKYENICECLSDTSVRTNLDFLFAGNNLDTFEDDSYIFADNNQLKFIETCFNQEYNEETCQRLNHLIQCTSFANYLCDFDLMIKLYNDDELATLDYDISYFLSRFSENEEMLQKALEFIKIRPDLAFRASSLTWKKFMEIDLDILIKVLDYMEQHHLLHTETDIELLVKRMTPKSGIKKLLKRYKKNTL